MKQKKYIQKTKQALERARIYNLNANMDKEQLLKILNSDEFMNNLKLCVNKFKASKGYKRWLTEYAQIDKQGLFTPKNLKEQYIKTLNSVSSLKYIYWEAIHYIGAQALDATKDYFDNCYYDIRVITGEIAEDSNGEELIYLSFDEARKICKTMNDEAEELLFRVYNSNTNKLVK